MGRRLGHDGEVIRFFFALAFSTLALAEPPLPAELLRVVTLKGAIIRVTPQAAAR